MNACFHICRVSERSGQLVEAIRRMGESPIPVPETQSAFHWRAQRNASVAAMCVDNPDRSPFKIKSVHEQNRLGTILRYWLKAGVRFDIALQKNRYVLLATTIFNVVAVP